MLPYCLYPSCPLIHVSRGQLFVGACWRSIAYCVRAVCVLRLIFLCTQVAVLAAEAAEADHTRTSESHLQQLRDHSSARVSELRSESSDLLLKYGALRERQRAERAAAFATLATGIVAAGASSPIIRSTTPPRTPSSLSMDRLIKSFAQPASGDCESAEHAPASCRSVSRPADDGAIEGNFDRSVLHSGLSPRSSGAMGEQSPSMRPSSGTLAGVDVAPAGRLTPLRAE